MASRIRENVQRFFECYCEVLKHPDGSTSVMKTYPPDYDPAILHNLPYFAYPCDIEICVVERFSFVLTNIDSNWMYGFCRHDIHTKRALVILSYLPHHDKFYRILDQIASMLQKMQTVRVEKLVILSDDVDTEAEDQSRLRVDFDKYLQLCYTSPPMSNVEYKLPAIPANVNLTEYYNAVDANGMMIILCSLLFERRIIVCSRRLSRLSACVQAANDLLYPLVWQHIFIPILPNHLSDYLLAPMPYLIGVQESVFKKINKDEIGDIVFLDADKNTVTTPFNDLDNMPPEAIKGLRRALKGPHLLNDVVARAFLQTVTYLIAGHRDAFRLENGDVLFDKDIFVSNRGSVMKPFLQTLVTTQTFEQFIEERTVLLKSGTTRSDEFERECCVYDENKLRSGARVFSNKLTETLHLPSKIFRQVRDKILNKNSNAVKTIKWKHSEKDTNKAHPAVESAVESVKSGRRGMRSAYRDLRSKLENMTVNNDSLPRSSRSRSASRPSNKHIHNFETIEELSTPDSDLMSTSVIVESRPLHSMYDDKPNISSSARLTTDMQEKRKVSFVDLPLSLAGSDPEFRNKVEHDAFLSLSTIEPLSPLSPLFSQSFLEKSIEEDFRKMNHSPARPTRQLTTPSENDLLGEYGLDLIKLNEPPTLRNRPSVTPSEFTLLEEYGLDINRFRLSRNNWTTFN